MQAWRTKKSKFTKTVGQYYKPNMSISLKVHFEEARRFDSNQNS